LESKVHAPTQSRHTWLPAKDAYSMHNKACGSATTSQGLFFQPQSPYFIKTGNPLRTKRGSFSESTYTYLTM
jgi:hypothetical protein